MCGRRAAAGRSRSALEQSLQLVQRTGAARHVDLKRRQRAHHPPREARPRDLKLKEAVNLTPTGSEHASQITLVGLLREREGLKIMQSDQRRGSSIKQLPLEPIRTPPRPPAQERAALTLIPHSVDIGPRDGIGPGVERLFDRLRCKHRHIIRQKCIQRPRSRRLARVRRNLRKRMNAGISTPGNRQRSGFTPNHRKRPLKLPLNGPLSGLPCPTTEQSSVIFNSQLGSHKRNSDASTRPPRQGPWWLSSPVLRRLSRHQAQASERSTSSR